MTYMPRKKVEIKEEDTVVETVETVEAPKEAKKPASDARKALEALIASYKEQNPEKYEAKKEELEAKLKSL